MGHGSFTTTYQITAKIPWLYNLQVCQQRQHRQARSPPKAWHLSMGESSSWLRRALGLLLIWVPVVMLSAHPRSTKTEFEKMESKISAVFSNSRFRQVAPLPEPLVCLLRLDLLFCKLQNQLVAKLEVDERGTSAVYRCFAQWNMTHWDDQVTHFNLLRVHDVPCSTTA